MSRRSSRTASAYNSDAGWHMVRYSSIYSEYFRCSVIESPTTATLSLFEAFRGRHNSGSNSENQK